MMRRFALTVRAAWVVIGVLVTVVIVAPAWANGGAGDDEKKADVKTVKKPEKPVLKKEYLIQIKNHEFIPAELTVPAGKKIKLRIENLDESPEEFESYDLNREKIVGGKKKITVFIGPLKPGKYSYFGEFNPETAQGVIIAK